MSTRNARFQLGRALTKALPGLKGRMPCYDAVKPMIEVGRAQIFTEHQEVNLDPAEAAFAATLPDPIPARVERSVALIALDDVTVLGSTGAVIDETRERLLTVWGARPYATYHDFRLTFSTPVRKPDGIYFNMMAGHRGYEHYYHFMFDRLPRLYYLLNRFDLGAEQITVLTNADLPKLQQDIYGFVRQRYPNLRFQAIPRHERWRVPRLFHVDDYQPVMRTFANPDALEFMRSVVFEGYSIRQDAGSKRRIYVSRKDTRRRRVANEREIMPILAKHGFETVTPGALSFRDQAALFSDAEMIAGPHGAGLTNILFAPASAKVLEFFPTSRLNTCYFLLSVARGQTYRGLIGDAGNRWEWFKVDAFMVERMLDALVTLPRSQAAPT